MTEKDVRKHAEAWVQYRNIPEDSAARKELAWANNEILEMICDDEVSGEILWLWILEVVRILEADPKQQNDALKAVFAAGPLERILAHYGEAFIDRVEDKAKQSAYFRNLLGGVWKSSIPEPVWARVQKASGPNW